MVTGVPPTVVAIFAVTTGVASVGVRTRSEVISDPPACVVKTLMLGPLVTVSTWFVGTTTTTGVPLSTLVTVSPPTTLVPVTTTSPCVLSSVCGRCWFPVGTKTGAVLKMVTVNSPTTGATVAMTVLSDVKVTTSVSWEVTGTVMVTGLDTTTGTVSVTTIVSVERGGGGGGAVPLAVPLDVTVGRTVTVRELVLTVVVNEVDC